MAVQAQYPSNVIFVNRNGQEGNDCSLQQPQSKEGYTPYNNNNNNNGSANSRKRGREAIEANTTPNNIMNPLFSMQSHPQQLINLSQLHNQHQNVGSIGLGLSFDGQQQQRLQLQQQQHGSHTSSYLSLSSEGFSLQIKQERDENDHFLHVLGEDLKSTLAAMRQRHYQELLGAAEEAVARRLREMEGDVDKATRRNAELEARAAQLSTEAQVWQAKARAHEAAAMSLQVQLQQTMMAAEAGRCHGGDDGCALDGGQVEDAESAYIDPDRVEVITSAEARAKCRGCGKRVASVMVLPCRHLCMCAGCDAHFRACPVCLTLKDSTVEVYLC
ncbi:hypothetical protein Lal_00029924 [Lupinus albus]|uniref:Putative transcription factor C2H2 family n=1 Tax=Lupinus albus TaxID=3870 RepID=A0A6A4PBH1_LUPAL|nr:putative transcription factor C2H2 family [Lupinus albus]KAF1874497.1 hypothetical protein Lal_00029924 [Lupinus albus]